MKNTNDRECMVRVMSEQTGADGEKQVIITKNKGRLFKKEGALYVRYTENMENTEETQGAAETENLLKIEALNVPEIEDFNTAHIPVRVTIKKSGAVSWEMTFQQGVQARATYKTPYGAFEMCAETTEADYAVSFRNGQEKISLQLAYTLFIQGEKQADCRLKLEIYFT